MCSFVLVSINLIIMKTHRLCHRCLTDVTFRVLTEREVCLNHRWVQKVSNSFVMLSWVLWSWCFSVSSRLLWSWGPAGFISADQNWTGPHLDYQNSSDPDLRRMFQEINIFRTEEQNRNVPCSARKIHTHTHTHTHCGQQQQLFFRMWMERGKKKRWIVKG